MGSYKYQSEKKKERTKKYDNTHIKRLLQLPNTHSDMNPLIMEGFSTTIARFFIRI